LEDIEQHVSVPLSEDDVKKIALSVLRNYYRFRVKSGNPEISSDLRGAGGIMADAAYTFKLPDGQLFTATIEATSADRSEEVQFRRQYWLLGWDALAGASMVTALGFAGTFLQGVLLVREWGMLLTLAALMLVIMLLTGVLMLVLHRLRRYRYIYAVEQFKRYYANEQWVAVSESVFDGRDDIYFQELRNQCIYNGFGFILVDETYKPQILLTPARYQVAEKQRKMIPFLTQTQFERLLQQGGDLRQWWKRFGRDLPMGWLTDDRKQFRRFQRPVYHQMVLTSIAFTIIATVVFLQWQMRPVRYVTQAVYAEEVQQRQSRSRPESMFYLIDTLALRPFDPTAIPYLLWLQSEEANMPVVASRRFRDAEVLMSLFDQGLVMYDCERLYNIKSAKYILQEGVYVDFERAMRRVDELLLAGVQANSLWLGCFITASNAGYVVYFDLMQSSLENAQKLALEYQKILKSKNLNINISIRMLMPPAE
jgi:hypothetical protein